MKKTMILILALIFVLTMAVSCGNSSASDDGEKNITADNNTEETTDNTEKTDAAAQNDAEVSDNTADLPKENDEIAADPFDTAFSLIDHPIADLYAAIGEPTDKSYASSCIGSGQDGELYYDGFIVCTYLEGERETVVDVYK